MNIAWFSLSLHGLESRQGWSCYAMNLRLQTKGQQVLHSSLCDAYAKSRWIYQHPLSLSLFSISPELNRRGFSEKRFISKSASVRMICHIKCHKWGLLDISTARYFYKVPKTILHKSTGNSWINIFYNKCLYKHYLQLL